MLCLMTQCVHLEIGHGPISNGLPKLSEVKHVAAAISSYWVFCSCHVSISVVQPANDIDCCSKELWLPCRTVAAYCKVSALSTGFSIFHAEQMCCRWYYASDMQTDEMYVWVGYDSRPNRPSFVPHSSFHNPNAPADAPDRESIELRAYVFWES